MKTFKLIFSASMLLLSACASMKVGKDKVQAVKRVAIVGFDVQQQRPVEMGDLFKAATHQSTASQAEVKGRTEALHVAKMYDNLRKKLESENHWQIIPQETLKANKAYQAIFKLKTDGWQNRPMINDRYVLMQPAGILDSFAIRLTEPEKLAQLQKDLNVDAILIVGIRVQLNNSGMMASLVGQGKFNPYAETNVALTDSVTSTTLWIDGNAKGEPVENETKNFMGLADAEKLNQLAVLAADSSYSKLLSNYKEKLAQ